ncbi:MAG: ribonuclease catalytic domain-containing protein, partial [Candidatus Latescibacteria bacterium]|nr:ribonuclease catalytic domain-containing protein [Candidatus Latescibacterota bacterium]
MNMMPHENEIVLFRYRNRLMAGVCINTSHSKARVAVSSRESLNVPLENIVHKTGTIGKDKKAGAKWLARAEAEGEHIDVFELWELVREEEGIWILNDLAELYFGDEPETAQISALLMALEVGDYFDAQGRGFQAVDEVEVERRLALVARAEERETERVEFVKWFNGKEPAQNAEWITRVKDVALNGEQSAQKQWLERMMGEGVSARRAFERLVVEGSWDQHVFVELMREEMPLVFTEAVVQEAEEIRLDALFVGREDLTHLDAVTIDDASTTDMDDAVSVQFYETGGFQVGVHITDVTALIPMGSALDEEARARGASLYFPEQKVPMLPPVLSEGLGSLKPNENRLAVSLLWDVSVTGQMGSPAWSLSVIRCVEKLSYDEVDAIFDDVVHPRHPMLSALLGVAEDLLVERVDAGAVVVDHVDRRVKVLEDGAVDVTLKICNSRADLLVSELMVMANVEAARLCVEQGAPAIFRVQKAPDLANVEPTEIETLHRFRVLTKMRAASASLEPGLHGGLGV